MTPRKTHSIPDVKPVTFERYFESEDGEQVVFELHDKYSNVGHIGVEWKNLGMVVQVIRSAAEKIAKLRESLGKSILFTGSSELSAQLVSTFQVSEYPTENVVILSLQSPTGFRCDFAIQTDAVDQRGRPLHRAIAEELTLVGNGATQKPN